MKKKSLCLSLGLVLLALVLAACAPDGGRQAEEKPSQPEAQVMYYFDGVISKDGKVLFEAKANTDYLILTGRQGQQYYILETQETYDPERRNQYNEPLLTACRYCVYDLQGELLHDLTVPAEGDANSAVRYSFPLDGNLEKFRILHNQILQNGKVQVLDIEGNVLLEQLVLAADDLENWQDGYVWLEMADNFMQIRCSLYDKNYDPMEKTFFYDMNGQPLELAQDYDYVYNIYDDFSNSVSEYYGGYYENEQGQSMIDLLDGNGQVLVSGLNDISNYANGRFVVVRGFERGLMNVQGEWVYRESVFKELED